MKIYKYVLLHFVIRHHYSRLCWAFNLFSYWWLLRCHAFPLPSSCVRWDTWRGEHILPYIWGRGTASPCVSRHFNHWTCPHKTITIHFNNSRCTLGY